MEKELVVHHLVHPHLLCMEFARLLPGRHVVRRKPTCENISTEKLTPKKTKYYGALTYVHTRGAPARRKQRLKRRLGWLEPAHLNLSLRCMRI